MLVGNTFRIGNIWMWLSLTLTDPQDVVWCTKCNFPWLGCACPYVDPDDYNYMEITHTDALHRLMEIVEEQV